MPSWGSPSPLVQFPWATDTVKLRSHCIGEGEKTLSKESVQQCVNSVAKVCSLRRDVEDFARNFAEAFSPEEIGAAFKGNFSELVGQAKDLVLKEMGTSELAKNLGKKGFIARTLHSFFAALERFLKKIGMIDLLESVGLGSRENEAKKTQMALFSTIFTGLSTTLMATLGSVHGTIATAGIFLVLFGLGKVASYLSYNQELLPIQENWTEKHQKGELEVGYEKEGSLAQIADAFQTAEIDKRPLLLVGKSGVGKTERLKTLPQAIARGDRPELSGCQVLSVNVAEIPQQKDSIRESETPLSRMSDGIKGKRAKTIVILDNIHKACDSDADFRTSDQLKRMIDSPNDYFSRLIGVTTEDGLKKMSEFDPDFVARFRIIEEKNPTDQDALRILEDRLHKKAPDALVEGDSLEYLQGKVKEKVPRDQVSSMARCVQRTSKEQKRGLKKEDIDPLFEAKKELLEMKKSLFQMASCQNEEEQKLFFVLKKLLIPAMEESLKEKADEKRIKLWIDHSVVDAATRYSVIVG